MVGDNIIHHTKTDVSATMDTVELGNTGMVILVNIILAHVEILSITTHIMEAVDLEEI